MALPPLRERFRNFASLSRQVRPTLELVWKADPRGAIATIALTLIAAVLPPALAWVGKLIIDAVVAASRNEGDPGRVIGLVGLELGLMVISTLVTRLLGLQRELLRARLGNLINLRILDKALELELRHFEDSDTYDKMQNARREASARPLSLALQFLSIGQNAVTLASFAALLVSLSPWSVLVIVAASVPAFIVEARLSDE